MGPEALADRRGDASARRGRGGAAAPSELLVTESYPGASAHTVLLVRPDGHLVAAFGGVRPDELYAAADAARGGGPGPSSAKGRAGRTDRTVNIN